MRRQTVRAAAGALVLLILAAATACAQKRERVRDDDSRREGAAAVARRWNEYRKVVRLNDGREVDLTRTLRRVADGRSLRDVGLPRHDGDGTVFLNLRDRRAGRRPLPDAERGYYVEYVQPPPRGVRWPGPERVIVGRRGEVYYSPDHYDPETIVTMHGGGR